MAEESKKLSLVPDPSTSDDDAVTALEREVARRRERLSSTLQHLRTELQEVSEWRHWYERHPVSFIAGAALLGWTAGQILTIRRS